MRMHRVAAMDDSTRTRSAAPGPPAQAPDPSASWSAMAVLGAAQLMVMLDSTVVNVALPSIGRSLPAGTAALQWTVGSYVLTYGSLLLLGGRIADVFGRRRSFLAGLALFGAASALCGLAPATPALLAGRFAQGAGAAVLSAAALSAVLAVYRSPGRRRIALAAWSGLGVVGATIGVILGGLLTTALGWRWAFLINVPVAVLTGLAALRAVPPLAAVRRRPLRLPIALLTTGGPAALSYGLIRLQDGVGTPAAWAGIAVAVLLLALVTVRQAGAEDPLLPLHLLRSPTYALSCAGLSLAAAVMIGGTYLAAGYFQRAHGMPAFAAGLALLPMGLSSLLVAVVVPRLAGRLGPARLYLCAAAAQLAGAVILVAGAGDALTAGVALVIIGAGLPSGFVPLYAIGSSRVRPAESGVASGLLNTFNQTGGAFGVAVAGTVAAAAAASSLRTGATAAEAAVDATSAGFAALAGCAVAALLVAAALIRLTRPTTAYPDRP
ncbi:MFS transporter [Thermopolyspora flexuosa]|uniref:MFS transporter n=2 Tax=Thermopolyspora flexuosa TaxID=103836 RepID=A0A543IV46_9ACTN|nr:MFS transporter [Thermopolyspora flexuosa]